MAVKALNGQSIEREARPIKILQFGEGNFLRAFVDWQVDIANEMGVMDAGIAICKPRPNRSQTRGTIEILKEQDCLYHTYLEGIKDKKPMKEVRLIKSVQCAINPYEEYEAYERIILSPELEIVISNTTEAGIRYEEGDDLTACPPKSYPAKVTALLYRRFKHYGGDPTKGLCVICCELIEDNGSTLREYVLRHAAYNGLEQEFVEWVEQHCSFCDTLVDRIVPGFPSDSIGEIKEELGFDDNLVVKAYKVLAADHRLPKVKMALYKNIPTGAGLGGGSADAAFTLKMLNSIAGLGLSDDKLEEYAARIGADCAFFIRNTPAYATGIGNILSPTTCSLNGYTLALVKPEIHISTKEAYSLVRPATPEVPLAEIAGMPVEEWKGRMKNDFEKSVFAKHPSMEKIKEKLYAMGAVYASMSGSGSAFFGLFKEELPVENLKKHFPGMFCWSRRM